MTIQITHSTGRFTFWCVRRITIGIANVILTHYDRPDSILETEPGIKIKIIGLEDK